MLLRHYTQDQATDFDMSIFMPHGRVRLEEIHIVGDYRRSVAALLSAFAFSRPQVLKAIAASQKLSTASLRLLSVFAQSRGSSGESRKEQMGAQEHEHAPSYDLQDSTDPRVQHVLT